MKIPFDDPKELAEQDKAKVISANMIEFGSGFSKHLGKKLSQMNFEEITEFKKDWPSYWDRFLKMSEV